MASIGFLGAGKVVETIVKGLLLADALPVTQMMASAPTQRNLKILKELGIKGTHSNKEIIANYQTVFISVKPNMVATVLKEISPVVTPSHMLVSLAAGISISFIESKLPVGSRVIRAMPNTPCEIGQGATMFTCGSAVKAEDKALVESYFGSLGYCMEGDETMIDAVMAVSGSGPAYKLPVGSRVIRAMPNTPGEIGQGAKAEDKALVESYFGSLGYCMEGEETMMDAVMAVSGSGPAYAYIAIDALADGGVKMGLPRDIAIKLAAQTLRGSAQLVLQGKKHPSQLKDDVCSPGGTTIDAIHELEKGGFRKCLIEAVEAACLKAKKLNTMNAQNK